MDGLNLLSTYEIARNNMVRSENLQRCQNKKDSEIHLNHHVWKLISKHLCKQAENMKLKSVSLIMSTFKPDEEKEQGWYVDGEDASQQRSS